MKKKKLYRRSRKERLIAGVLGGVSEYYDQDPTLVRIIWLLIIGATGFIPGILVYILTILIVPTDKKKN